MRTLKAKPAYSIFPVLTLETAEFFVATPVYHEGSLQIITEDNPWAQDDYLSGYLKLPVSVPNFMGLCRTPHQTIWGDNDDLLTTPVIAGFIANVTNLANGQQELVCCGVNKSGFFNGVVAGTVEFDVQYNPQTLGLDVTLVGYEQRSSASYSINEIVGVLPVGYARSYKKSE